MSDISIALNRFGLGARPHDEIGDPKGWLKDQLAHYQPRLVGVDALASRGAIIGALADYRMAQRDARQQKRADTPQMMPTAAVMPAPSQGMTPDTKMQADAVDKPGQQFRQFQRQQYIAQVGLRAHESIATDTPFVERLVQFWANHFAVSADKQTTIALAGLLEFEAIRPHVLGRFEDMLIAVEQHPAMLLYLDQAQSVGPDSRRGARAAANGRKVGLNENLGREIMELHTLGVRTGYDQSDVTEFARALTGWTVAGFNAGASGRYASAQPGEFLFASPLHEPGARTIMGKNYGQDGEAQARAVLADLARNPATAWHLATKLARHFVADEPPPALVAKLEKAYVASNGDLPTVYRALIDAPESWVAGSPKFRTPWEWTIAVFRGVDNGPDSRARKMSDQALANMVVQLGQPVWKPGSPAGFDDIAASWAGPDALYRRVELSERIASQAASTVDPRALAATLFPASLSPATAQAIARADSPQQGLALLFVSPEMLRR